MEREVRQTGDGTSVVLMDSISFLQESDAGEVAVTGSHGGRSSGLIASRVQFRVAFFNDAGGGKENAGLAGLEVLELLGIPAGTVGHESARIGDASDSWESGIITHLNQPAVSLGLVEGTPLKQGVGDFLSRSRESVAERHEA
jgi:hypothetical protein